jgi:hypothetical protein
MEVCCDASHEDIEHAIGYMIVYGLKNHIVICDNFFSSLTLI